MLKFCVYEMIIFYITYSLKRFLIILEGLTHTQTGGDYAKAVVIEWS